MASGSPVKVFTFTSPRMPCAPMITPSRSVLGGTVSAMRQARRSAGSGFVGGRRRRGSSFGSGLGGFLGGLDVPLRLRLRLGLFRGLGRSSVRGGVGMYVLIPLGAVKLKNNN